MNVYASRAAHNLVAWGPSSRQPKTRSFLTDGERVKLTLVSFLVLPARNLRQLESTSPTCDSAQLLHAVKGREVEAKNSSGVFQHTRVSSSSCSLDFTAHRSHRSWLLKLFPIKSRSTFPSMTLAATKVALTSLLQAALPPQSATFSLIRRLTNPCS